MHSVYGLIVSLALLATTSADAQGLNSPLTRKSLHLSCKVIPSDPEWPSEATFHALNTSLGGVLSAPHPSGQACYAKTLDRASCQAAIVESGNETLLTEDPLGYIYPPINLGCAPLQPKLVKSDVCSLKEYPRYIVEATRDSHVQKAVNFAREHDIRLVVKATGHSLSGGSLGPDSLLLWTHKMRSGIHFQKSFESCNGCKGSKWTGAALTYSAGYQWSDIYLVAQANNVIVVGGGDPTVSASGGYVQNGGHSPASQKFGLAVAQVLEYQVVQASGELVTANACTNQDLFWALRGGGGGTYGIVVSVTIKAFPEEAVTTQVLQVVPKTPGAADKAAFVQALNILYAAFPGLTDAGAGGASQWKVDADAPFVTGSSSLTGYQGAMIMFDTEAAYKKAFKPALAKLDTLSSHLNLTVEYIPFPSYFTYYNAVGISTSIPSPIGSGSALASRLLDRHGLTRNATGLSHMINTLIGQPGDNCEVDLEVVGGGMTATTSGALSVSPGWTTAIVHSIISRSFAVGTSAAEVQALRNDLTYNRNAAQIALAPDTGAYMNEGDLNDPDFQCHFWGSNAPRLLRIKAKYDPTGLFYCPVCLGSGNSATDASGRLCTES